MNNSLVASIMLLIMVGLIVIGVVMGKFLNYKWEKNTKKYSTEMFRLYPIYKNLLDERGKMNERRLEVWNKRNKIEIAIKESNENLEFKTDATVKEIKEKNEELKKEWEDLTEKLTVLTIDVQGYSEEIKKYIDDNKLRDNKKYKKYVI